jgi:hypothetical protein
MRVNSIQYFTFNFRTSSNVSDTKTLCTYFFNVIPQTKLFQTILVRQRGWKENGCIKDEQSKTKICGCNTTLCNANTLLHPWPQFLQCYFCQNKNGIDCNDPMKIVCPKNQSDFCFSEWTKDGDLIKVSCAVVLC